MHITAKHRRAAHALWECGGRIEDAAARSAVRPDIIRRWLADPAFRAILAQDAMEPLLQATSAVLRWAPVAVARLIEDLEGESPEDARRAAREILKLAIDTQQELARRAAKREPGAASPEPDAEASGKFAAPGGPTDPLSMRVAGLTDDQLSKMLAILNGEQGNGKPQKANGNQTAKGKQQDSSA